MNHTTATPSEIAAAARQARMNIDRLTTGITSGTIKRQVDATLLEIGRLLSLVQIRDTTRRTA